MSSRQIDGTDIDGLYKFFAERAVAIFNDKKVCLPQLAAVIIGDKPGEIASMMFIDPRLVNEMQRSAGSKDGLMLLVRVLLAKGEWKTLGIELPKPCDAVVHVSEAWVAEHPADKRDQLPDSFEDHPGRGEVIMVVVHTHERSYPGMCPITGSGDARTAAFAALRRGGEFEGRFAMQDGHATH